MFGDGAVEDRRSVGRLGHLVGKKQGGELLQLPTTDDPVHVHLLQNTEGRQLLTSLVLL